MFTTISTYYTFPKTIEQIRQNMTGYVTSRYQGLNSRTSSEVGAKIENLGTRLVNASEKRPRGTITPNPPCNLVPYYYANIYSSNAIPATECIQNKRRPVRVLPVQSAFCKSSSAVCVLQHAIDSTRNERADFAHRTIFGSWKFYVYVE